MKKNINKLVAFAIGVSVMSGSIVPAFADDNTTKTTNTTSTTSAANTTTSTSTANNNNVIYVQGQMKPILTLKQAISSAISNSEKLALKSKEIKLYKDQLEIQDEINDVVDSDNDFPYDQLEVLLKQSEVQKEYLKDQIAQDITDKYNNLVAQGNNITKFKKQIQIRTKLINDDKLRKDLGLKTSIEVKTSEIDLQTLKNSEIAKEKQLRNSEDYFAVLTGIDVSKYSLEQDQKYEAFRINGSEDEYFDKVIDKYMKYNKKLLELSKDNLKDNKVDKPDSDVPDKDNYHKDEDGDGIDDGFDSAGYAADLQDYISGWTTYGQYLQNKYNLSSQTVSYNDGKKSLKDGLKQSYASLIDMENSINVLKSTIEVNNKQLSVAKLKYDMGLMTKTDYDNQVLANTDLETNLRNLINNYNSLKSKIQKPWLLNSSSSTSGIS